MAAPVRYVAAWPLAAAALIRGASRTSAPVIAGIPMRNENSAADAGASPSQIPVTIVDPDRLTPGRIASAWAQPIHHASSHVGSFVPAVLSSVDSAACHRFSGIR